MLPVWRRNDAAKDTGYERVLLLISVRKMFILSNAEAMTCNSRGPLLESGFLSGSWKT